MGVYESLGVKPIINASGAVTRLGGAPMSEAVLAAFRDAAAETVPLEQLQAAASRRIAKATGTEAGMVTSGAASALTLGAAAILARYDLGRMERLPDTSGFKNEFIVSREQRNGYDHAVRLSGAKLVEVGFNEITANAGVRRTEVWEFADAITDKTAGILYVYAPDSRPRLAELVEMARQRFLPVLVDAAGELPPRANLQAIAATGADLVAFSGGKAIGGPQATGILCGRVELVESALLQTLDMDDHLELWEAPRLWTKPEWLGGMPRHGIGRGFKVSKEQIVALLTALEIFVAGPREGELNGFRECLVRVQGLLEGLPLETRLLESSDGESLPLLEVTLTGPDREAQAMRLCRGLRAGDPPIYVGHGKLASGTLVVNPLHLRTATAITLGERLRDEFCRLGEDDSSKLK